MVAHWPTTSLECSLSQSSLVHGDWARWEQLIYIYIYTREGSRMPQEIQELPRIFKIYLFCLIFGLVPFS